MKKLFIIAFLLLPGIMLCAQDNNRRREGRRPQGSEMRRNFSPEALAKMEADAINEAVGLDSLQYQLVYILKYSDVAAMQDSMKARSARMEKRPIAHFAGCDPSQTCIPTGVLRGSNVSEYKSMVENAQ